MSTTIDNRVVEMQFDNKHFESNVQTTLSTLDKLKQSLNLTGATRGLENIDSAAKKVNMSGLSSAVETVQAKFSALQIIGVTALANISNSAVNAGKKIVSALTIDPIKTGFQEYETQINAVQTILANTQSKGTTLDDVTAALDELNTYADKTIYNFTEMTRNIGTFTAAGVDLDKSVTSIKGIANLAAVSGSTSQQASTAMYQLSQALASGKVSLMDWNSVVNAGMGGQVFQDALKRTARQQGHDVDALIEKYGSFRESLTQGNWLTAEVLTETLTQLSGAYTEADLIAQGYSAEQAKQITELAKTASDAATKVKTFTQLWDTLKESAQSGWTQTWEIIVGDFEEAKALLTKISDVVGGYITRSAEARNKILEDWKSVRYDENGNYAGPGGRTVLIEALTNAFEALLAVLKPIKEAFNEVIPPMTGQKLYDLTVALRDFTAKLKISDETADKLKRTFKGVFSVVDIVRQFFVAVFKGVGGLLDIFVDNGGGVLDVILGITAGFGDWLVKVNEAIRSGDIFNKIVQGIVDFVRGAAEAIGDFARRIADLDIFKSISEGVGDRMSQLGDAAISMGDGLAAAFGAMGSALMKTDLVKALQALWDGVKTVAGALTDGLVAAIEKVGEVLGGANFSSVLDIFNSAALGGVALAIVKFFKSLTDSFDGVGGLFEGVSDILDGVKGSLQAYQNQLNAEALIKIATAIAILAASLLVISLIDSAKLSAAIGAITMLFADLMGSMIIFGKFAGTIDGVIKTIGFMIGMATAIFILAGALKLIGSLDWNQMAVGLVGVVGLIAALSAAIIAISKFSDGAIKGALRMVIFAGAIAILGAILKSLSSLSWGQLAVGMTGLVGVTTTLVLASVVLSKFTNGGIKGALSMVIFASAIAILGSILKDTAALGWADIGKGLAGIAGVTAVLVLASIAMSKFSSGSIGSALSMVIFASAIAALGVVLQSMAALSWGELARGMVGVAGVIVALVAASVVLSKFSGSSIASALSMVIFAQAISTVANVLSQMGGMSWESIGKGLATLGGSLAILAIGLYAMRGSLAGSAALIVAAGAISILTPSLKELGSLSWDSIVKGLVTLAGAFTVIGVAGTLLGPMVPAILGLAGAFVLLGISVLAIGGGLALMGAGLSLIAAGISALAASIVGGATAIVAGLTVIVTGLASLIPAVAQKIGEAIIVICQVIAEGAPVIAEAVKAVILALVDILVECVPAIANGALQLVLGVLNALAEYAPQIVEALFDLVMGVLKALSEKVPEFIVVAVEFVMSIFKGVVDAIRGIDVGSLVQGLVGVGLMAGIMVALAAVASLVPGAMAGVLGMAAVIAELALVLAAIGALAQIPGLDWLINEGATLLASIGNAIGSLIGGIVGGVAEGMTASLPQIGTDLSNFMTNIQPFINGAKSIDESMMSGVRALADTILILTAADILDGLTSWITGGSSLTDFANQLVPFGTALKNFSNEVSGIDESAVTSAANAGKVLAQMADNLPNSGGLAAFFAGENDISTFGDKLVPFGKSLKQYSDAVVGINSEAVTASATAAKTLSELANNLPNSGGVAAFFAGENDISDFGEKLVPFGKSMKQYSDAVVGINADAISASATAAKTLSKLADNLPNSGGALSWLTGDNDLSSFASKLVPFGKSLKQYSDAVAGVNAVAITASATAVKQLVIVVNSMSGVDASGVESFKKAINDLATVNLKGFVNAFTVSLPNLTSIGSKMINAITKGFKSQQSSLGNSAKTIINSVAKTLNSANATFTKAGVHLMKGLASGIAKTGTQARVAVISAVASATTAAMVYYFSFYTAGTYLGSGLVSGINSKKTAAYNAGYALGQASAQGVKDGEKAASPSKEGIKAGKWLGEGVVIGINKMGDAVYSAGYGLGETAVNSLSNTISKISDAINSDIDSQPTIRPVLDLSDVRSGAGMINSMFGGMTPSMAVVGNVNGINASMNRRIQNGVNSDVVSAIDRLRKDVGNLENKTYSVGNITYGDDSAVANAIETLVRHVRVEGRV